MDFMIIVDFTFFSYERHHWVKTFMKLHFYTLAYDVFLMFVFKLAKTFMVPLLWISLILSRIVLTLCRFWCFFGRFLYLFRCFFVCQFLGHFYVQSFVHFLCYFFDDFLDTLNSDNSKVSNNFFWIVEVKKKL